MPFPVDGYTPYGYLDLPGHTRNLNPLGVMRSWDAGFRWHFPAYSGAYGGREGYHAGFRIALNGAGGLGQFDRVACPYHSKNVFQFDLERAGARSKVTYHSVGENVLRAVVETEGEGHVAVHAEYSRVLRAGGQWGETGLVGRQQDDVTILQAFEDGEAFALWTSAAPAGLAIIPGPEEAERCLAMPAEYARLALPWAGYVNTAGRRGDTVDLHEVIGFEIQPGTRLEVLMARGKTARQAMERLHAAIPEGERERERLVAEDDRFWETAPRLVGDWPDHWRRGLVYDLETLRMMVKQPAGVYSHAWDAMQIQAPRSVLAETAMDALVISYADPAMALELMRGVFANAAEPNVPCSREDGTYNMVAACGEACGTAPEWGYPWAVLRWLYDLHPDGKWLADIYPDLCSYLDWWLQNRRDQDGWLVYCCSWESGQDDSPRFGAQPLGGADPVRHVRPVDVQAAFAHAAGVMSGFATALGRTNDREKWRSLEAEFRDRTARLWNGERFADFDTMAGNFTEVNDVMLLAPAALRVGAPGQTRALRDEVERLQAQRLTWPMEAWTAVEAALATGLPEKAAALASALCARVYGFWDEREASPERTLPGISCEFWPLNGRCGGEGYGWGAFGVHLLLHAVVGFTPYEGGALVRPNLPLEWRVPGKKFGLLVHYHGRPVEITIAPLEAGAVRVSAGERTAELAWGEGMPLSSESG